MTNAPSPPPPANPRNGCLQALAIVIGMILLVPGVCGIILVSYDTRELRTDGTALLAAVGLIALGVCGIVVIWLAVRRRA
jgi:hypothetical protein